MLPWGERRTSGIPESLLSESVGMPTWASSEKALLPAGGGYAGHGPGGAENVMRRGSPQFSGASGGRELRAGGAADGHSRGVTPGDALSRNLAPIITDGAKAGSIPRTPSPAWPRFWRC
jgi:hypothetical protein